ncbi:MAG TPA: peptidoglycan recognition family protein [Chthoniobacterales bacterium]|nr:peptidoglycan recognition family protein [Chthoniobacterales bacterium]
MSNPTNRLRMAAKIVEFEGRRDSQGRLKVYFLPAGDGGGNFEVAGINDRYHPTEAAALRGLVEAGNFAEAEAAAQRYIASYTDAGDRWTPFDAVESYLRDCIFNRGAGGAAKIYQGALGVGVDGDVGPITIAAGERVEPAACLRQLRAARERYEREVARRDESSPFWRGLVNRWNNALAFAETFQDLGGNAGPSPAGERDAGEAGNPASEREPRPGEQELTGTEEALARRESGEEEGAATVDMNIRVLPAQLPSRSRSVRPTLVVLHATAGASAMSSINHLRGAGLSYHYIIARDGRDSTWTRETDNSTPIIFHCVADDREGFHTGSTIPAPSGEGRINKCSIGISLANLQSGGERYTPGQITALNQLLAHLKRTHPSLRHLTNHALVQPWNRADPLNINAGELAAAHGYTLFQPTAQQIREHRPP